MPDRRIVTDVRAHGKGSKQRTVSLDGEPWLTGPSDVLKELKIRQGISVDPEDLAARVHEVSPRVARDRALRLLAVRERSEAELVKRLLDDGYAEPVARDTVASLAGTGLVDDARFAESLARSLVCYRKFGRTRALREMTRRGLSDDDAREALDEIAPVEGETERAEQAARRLVRPNDTVARLAARLVRRGFSPGTAFRAARAAAPESPDEESFDGS